MSDEALIPRSCAAFASVERVIRTNETQRKHAGNGKDDTQAWLTNIESATVVNCNS
jgi:hypothetical protein